MKKTKSKSISISHVAKTGVNGMGRTIPKPNIATGSHKPKPAKPPKKK